MKGFACLWVVGGIVVGFLLPLSASGIDDGHPIATVSLAAKQQEVTPVLPWVSSLRITDNDHSVIRLADGERLMQRPIRAASYNDGNYDVAEFYEADSARISMVWHYAGRKAGEIISVGIDSGYRADKITIRPALFIGYAQSMELEHGKYLTFAIGGWLGGKSTHKPCSDAFDREYYCGNLTAWADFRSQRDELQHYYRLVYKHEF